MPHKVGEVLASIHTICALDTLEECGKKGVKGVVIVSGGFSEIEKERETRLLGSCL